MVGMMIESFVSSSHTTSTRVGTDRHTPDPARRLATTLSLRVCLRSLPTGIEEDRVGLRDGTDNAGTSPAQIGITRLRDGRRLPLEACPSVLARIMRPADEEDPGVARPAAPAAPT